MVDGDEVVVRLANTQQFYGLRCSFLLRWKRKRFDLGHRYFTYLTGIVHIFLRVRAKLQHGDNTADLGRPEFLVGEDVRALRRVLS
jgi:hypothetical protein